MRVRRGASTETKVEQQMTPMIDVVFQLLTFFILSFKVVSLEGDFNIKMPLGQAKPSNLMEPTVPPMKIRMTADGAGKLSSLKLNEAVFPAGDAGFDGIRSKISKIITDAGGAGPGGVRETAEVELDCDFNLKYEYVIQAITAVSGYKQADGTLVRLVEKVKFSPPRAGGE
jgi:biopolymer transport protein ExbD